MSLKERIHGASNHDRCADQEKTDHPDRQAQESPAPVKTKVITNDLIFYAPLQSGDGEQ